MHAGAVLAGANQRRASRFISRSSPARRWLHGDQGLGKQISCFPSLKLRPVQAFKHCAPGRIGINNAARTRRSPGSQGRPGPRPAARRDREIRSCSAATARWHSSFSRPAPGIGRTRDHACSAGFHPASASESISRRARFGKAPNGFGEHCRKAHTVLNRESVATIFPLSALSISGSLCGRRQTAKGSGHTRM